MENYINYDISYSTNSSKEWYGYTQTKDKDIALRISKELSKSQGVYKVRIKGFDEDCKWVYLAFVQNGKIDMM